MEFVNFEEIKSFLEGNEANNYKFLGKLVDSGCEDLDKLNKTCRIETKLNETKKHFKYARAKITYFKKIKKNQGFSLELESKYEEFLITYDKIVSRKKELESEIKACVKSEKQAKVDSLKISVEFLNDFYKN